MYESEHPGITCMLERDAGKSVLLRRVCVSKIEENINSRKLNFCLEHG